MRPEEEHPIENLPTPLDYRKGYLLGLHECQVFMDLFHADDKGNEQFLRISNKYNDFANSVSFGQPHKVSLNYRIGYLDASVYTNRRAVEIIKQKHFASFPRGFTYIEGYNQGKEDMEFVCSITKRVDCISTEDIERHFAISDKVDAIGMQPEDDYGKGYLDGWDLRLQQDTEEDPKFYEHFFGIKKEKEFQPMGAGLPKISLN